ncbi:hypothetical protein BDN72DRAFT_751085, partial [Pluteus cervinus]
KVEAEISRQENQIRLLRGLRNTLLPISSIPNEILSKIFLECHEVDLESNSNFDIPGDDRSLDSPGKTRLILSWVSSHWRAVALSYSELWSLATGGNQEYIEECIARSKDLDLSFVLRNPRRQLLQICLAQLPRLASL